MQQCKNRWKIIHNMLHLLCKNVTTRIAILNQDGWKVVKFEFLQYFQHQTMCSEIENKEKKDICFKIEDEEKRICIAFVL